MNDIVNLIANKMLLYTKANGVELQGLVNRRKAENKLFTKKWGGSDDVKGIFTEILY